MKVNRFARLGCAVGLWLAAAGGAAAAPALWVVKDADSTIYLFGTMHALQPQTQWRTPVLDDAYAKANVVWFELDMNQAADSSAVLPLVARYGFDTERTLDQRLPKKDWKALEKAFKKAGVPTDRIRRMQPWMAGLMISVLPMVKAGYSPLAGADMTLSQGAQTHQQTRYFETMEEQLRFLAELPEAAQVQMVQDALAEQGQTATQTGAIQAAWSSGDVTSMGDLVLKVLREQRPDFYGALIGRRNARWVDTLAKEMDGSGTEIVNVGMLHMLGEEGLPAQLKARGYSVERVQ